MIEEFQLVFTRRDKDERGELSINHTFKYIEAIVKLLQ